MGMQSLKCPSCGANIELDDSREFGFCTYCGTKVMQDKIVIEHKGTVKIDDSVELKNLYELARRAKDTENAENAKKYYNRIIVKDPSSWEANFYTTYYQAIDCNDNEIDLAATRLHNCEEVVFKLIKENVTSENEQEIAVDEVAAKLIYASNMLFNVYSNYYGGTDGVVQQYADNYYNTVDVLFNGGDCIEKLFGDKFGYIAANCWKLGNMQMSTFEDNRQNADLMQEYTNKILKYDPSYIQPKLKKSRKNEQTGACYVATAVYGSYDCPQVWTLRRYRDNHLAKFWYGRAFIYAYYAISPTVVKWFGNAKWFKSLWRVKLDKMVKSLNSKGFENTPYNDINW